MDWGEDVYKAGKRDIATLYEYWLFFVLYDVFKAKFNLDSLSHEEKPYNHLLETTKNGVNLIIKAGQHTALKGDTVIKNRALSIKFSFNRTFSGNKDSYPNAGSWTTSMRPDYTLSVWPKELTETKAEEEEQIVHIHFDAKYKVSHFNVKTNDEKTSPTKEEIAASLERTKKEERAGIYKNADLLKMHAYKDAIRRTGGAYILYPGTTEKRFKGFHELIPGLGAFSLNPNNETEDKKSLSNFIEEVINHLVDRASQREQIAVKTFKINKNSKPDKLHEPLPEYLGENKLIPDETFVLVGFYNTEAQYKWIQKGYYNFRMGSGNGSLALTKETVAAKYLLLHTHGDESSLDLFKIISEGPRVFSRLNLEMKGYPKAEKEKEYQKFYLLINIEKVSRREFGEEEWDFKKHDNYDSGHASAFPYTTTLTELLSKKVAKI